MNCQGLGFPTVLSPEGCSHDRTWAQQDLACFEKTATWFDRRGLRNIQREGMPGQKRLWPFGRYQRAKLFMLPTKPRSILRAPLTAGALLGGALALYCRCCALGSRCTAGFGCCPRPTGNAKGRFQRLLFSVGQKSKKIPAQEGFQAVHGQGKAAQ